MEYCSAMKKEEPLSFATTQMDPAGIMLNEISQTEKDKCCMNLQVESSYIKKKYAQLIDKEVTYVVTREWGSEKGGQEYKLPVIR